MLATKEIVDQLNSLLRGEIAATETYNQALEKFAVESYGDQLRQIRDEHRTFANELRQHVHHHGGKPDQDSGVWGTFAKAVEGSAKALGAAAALQALKQGEESGVGSYESALKQDLPADCQALVRKMFQSTRAHIQTLDGLMAKG